MEFINLENKLKELSERFTTDLISLLDSKGHHRSGALDSSIIFSFIKDGADYKIRMTALDYIKYLEGGNLLKNFLLDKRKEMKKEIATAIKKDLLSTIKKK